MKDYLVVNGAPDIVFAFNDEMAYGAYIAGEQLRMGNGTKFVGVDGFEGESAGLNLVEKEILDATIQSPDFGSLAYDAAMDILKEKEVTERHHGDSQNDYRRQKIKEEDKNGQNFKTRN